MRSLRNRAAQKARRAASGGDGPPAGRDPQTAGQPATADRGARRKHLRRARHTRDALLHDLGALVMEMYRQGRHDPALVERKAREAVAADAEVRALTGALDRDEPLSSVQAAGIAAPCTACGNLLARDDRYCGHCGTPAGATANGAVPQGAPPPSEADRVPTYSVTAS